MAEWTKNTLLKADNTSGQILFFLDENSDIRCSPNIPIKDENENISEQYSLNDIYSAAEILTLKTLLKQAKDKLLTDKGFAP